MAAHLKKRVYEEFSKVVQVGRRMVTKKRNIHILIVVVLTILASQLANVRLRLCECFVAS